MNQKGHEPKGSDSIDNIKLFKKIIVGRPMIDYDDSVSRFAKNHKSKTPIFLWDVQVMQ